MLITAAAALMAIGIVMVASTTAALDRSLIESLSWRHPFGRQCVYVIAGFAVMIAVSRLARPWLNSPSATKTVAKLLFVVSLIGLLIAVLPGMTEAQRGSHRWLRFTPGGHAVHLQPSELAKLGLVVFLAWFLADRRCRARDGGLPGRGAAVKSFMRRILPKPAGRLSVGATALAALAVAVCVLLVGKEDFGTASLVALVGGAMLVIAGARIVPLFSLGAIGGIALAAMLYFVPYRRARITGFLSIMEDPQGAGYQPLQSLATIASGGWFGQGLGAGVQKYGYLPESHTDFIFAVICEETGFLGALVVIMLLVALVWLGAKAMWRAASEFERLLAFGLTSLLAWQAVMNIAVVVVVTPTTGISLPFVSSGGSGTLTYCVIVGLLAAIASRGGPQVQVAEAPASNSDVGPIRYGIA